MKTTFETLIRRISPKLHGITHKLNGHFTFFNDDDLYQEALAHLWADYGQGKCEDKTDSYVLQGCYFHLKNYIRTVSDKVPLDSLNAIIGEDGAELEELIPDKSRAIEDAADTAILEESISRISLTGREREVLASLLEGMTTREIGGRLGVSHVMVVKIRKNIERKCAALKKVGSCSYQS